MNQLRQANCQLVLQGGGCPDSIDMKYEAGFYRRIWPVVAELVPLLNVQVLDAERLVQV